MDNQKYEIRKVSDMLSRVRSIIILTLFVHLFAGCDYLDGDKDVEMWIEAAGVVSVSYDRPAKVVIGAVGVHSNTCVRSRNAEVYATREDNNIHLTAKKGIPYIPSLCGSTVTGVYGEVTLKNLKVGEYKILDDTSRELGRFRIEENRAFVDVKPIINGFIVSPIFRDNDELEDTSYSVSASIGIEEVHEVGCDLIVPRTILRRDLKETEPVINIDIRRVVPNVDSPCGVISFYQPPEDYGTWTYNTEIYLGVFSAGSHSVVLSGMNYLFDIPLQVDWEGIKQIIIPPKTDAATPMREAGSLH